MEIYRVPGSVSFLHSGALLHAILPRSQCWCVDGTSKFALRVLPDTYYRIELPGETSEDLEQVEALRVTLRKVLFFERTPCPFARTFTVAIAPDEPINITRIDPPEEPAETRRMSRGLGPAKKWKLDRAYSWKPENGEEPRQSNSGDTSEESEGAVSEGDTMEIDVEKKDVKDIKAAELANERSELSVDPPSRPNHLATARSITAPPQLTMRKTPMSNIQTNVAVDGLVEVLEQATVSQPVAQQPSSLRTFQAMPTDMPPSPPDSSAGIEPSEASSRFTLGDLRRHEPGAAIADEVSNASRTPSAVSDRNSVVALPSTHGAVPSSVMSIAQQLDGAVSTGRELDNKARAEDPTSASDESPQDIHAKDIELPALVRHTSPEDPFAAIQARILARRSIGGTTSFHPKATSSTSSSASSTATAGSAVSRRSESTQHQQAFATALVRKACAVFLGPPAHLVVIMLRIAARFASGAFGLGSSFIIESPAGSKHVPGSFNLESVDADDFADDLEWEEDDFGVPLRSPVRLAALGEGVGGAKERKGWELE